MTKRVLIAGGAGFLGRNLTKTLLAEGHTVHCIDNFSTGHKRNVKEFIGTENYSLQELDISEEFSLNGKFEAIYNLACPASPPAYQLDPLHTLATCYKGSVNLLELALQNDCTILQASTSEIYGDPEISPQREDYRGNVNPIGIRACYDEGKRVAETLFFDYHRMFGVKIKVIRIFNTYGPFLDQDDGRVVSNFICQALQGKDLTIYGSGNQTRSFCYVDDLVQGITSVMNSDNSIMGPVNLGNPNEIEVIKIAEKIIELTNSSSKIVFRPLPLDDPMQRKPDITKAKKLLRWEPKIDLETGLRETISYFRNLV